MAPFLLILAVMMPAAATACAQEPPIEYVVRLHGAAAQIVQVTMIVRDVSGPTLDVALPVWRPGRYEVLDQAGTVRSLSARRGDGRPLGVDKIAKSTWRIDTGPAQVGDEVVVDYSLYANALGNRTRHADDTHAFLSGAAVFLFRPGRTGDGPLRVRIDAPDGWDVATGLEPEAGGDPRVLTAADYDSLADAPIEVGVHERVRFDVDGTPHEIALWSPGGRPGYALEKWPEDFARIVREQRSIFGRLPYQRYIFLVHSYPGGSGGTEHLNSTIMQTSPSRLESAEAFKGFLGLVSHEFFHTWNVKQFRPAGIKPYDYLHENYTRLLWVAEGTTSYYGPLTLVRAGITRPDDYLRSLGDAIDALRRRPGAAVQSLEESSFDAWIKFNKSWPDSGNATVSFYDKGALVSMALDMEVRRRSGGVRSFDDVVRGLFERFPREGPAYTTDDLLMLLRQAAGAGFEDFFARYVAGVEPIDFEAELATAGLELSRGESGAQNDRAYTGITLTDSGGLASVTGVASDGPAYAAGIIAGDLIVAINGRRATAGGFDGLLRTIKPGEPVRVSLFRYDTLRQIEFIASGRPEAKWMVRRVKEPTEAQRAVYESWLGQKWPDDRARPGNKEDK
jgi:predicted metalloprotease with PDZ domain